VVNRLHKACFSNREGEDGGKRGSPFRSGYNNNKVQVMSEQQKPIEFSTRSFNPGDAAHLVDFLNFCYPGGWGNSEQWEWRYLQDPSFKSSNIFIIESGGQIVGHRSSHPRQLIIRGKKVPIAFLGGTATHPDYRGLGLYSRLHQATLKAAKLKGACLAVTGNSQGSITYNHNKKTGFIEVKHSPTYIKPINHEKVFKGMVSNFVAQREKLKSLLQGLETKLNFRFGKADFSLDELLNEDSVTPAASSKRGEVTIALATNSFSLLVQFIVGGKLQKMKTLLSLLFSQKMKIGFSSPLALGKFAWAGIRMVKYV